MPLAILLTPNEIDAMAAAFWIVVAVVSGLVIHRVLRWVLNRWAQRHHSAFAAALIRRTERPAAYIVPFVAILVAMQIVDLPASWTRPVVLVSGLLTIGSVAWSLIALIRLWGDLVLARHQVDAEDNLLARQLGTRVNILSRTAVTLVIIVAVGMMLMTFPPVRALGTALLASAGLAGIIVVLSARSLFE